VIDDHPLVRIGVRKVLDGDFEIHESASREEGLDLVRDIGDFDVAIVDMRWRQNGLVASISGQEAIRELRRSSPVLGIVAYVARTTDPAALRKAVDAAAAQESFVDPAVPPKGSRGKLTRRHRQILQLLANGESTTVAARELDLSEETVKTHMKNAMARLGAKNRTHAVAIALRECLID
jgi:DNA-binding NarL/FixJ family response regulator